MNDNADFDPDDDEDEPLEVGGELVLLFTSEGGCILEENGEGVWFSDDDDDFHEHFQNDFLTADEDDREVLDWLVENEWLEEEEKSQVKIEEENEDEDDSERISHNKNE